MFKCPHVLSLKNITHHCTKSFDSGDKLVLHCKAEHCENICYCVACNKIFQRKVDLELHKKNCHLMKHVCSLCDLKFYTGRGLSEHRTKVHNLQGYTCTECPYSTDRKSSFVRHFGRKHGSKGEPRKVERLIQPKSKTGGSQKKIWLNKDSFKGDADLLYQCKLCKKPILESLERAKVHLFRNHGISTTSPTDYIAVVA